MLRVETEREKELVQQLNKMKREFDDFKERSTRQWEEEMKRRDSRFCFFCFFLPRDAMRARYMLWLVSVRLCHKWDFY